MIEPVNCGLTSVHARAPYRASRWVRRWAMMGELKLSASQSSTWKTRVALTSGLVWSYGLGAPVTGTARVGVGQVVVDADVDVGPLDGVVGS